MSVLLAGMVQLGMLRLPRADDDFLLARISAMLAMAGLLSRLPASIGLGKKAAVSASIPPSPERAQRQHVQMYSYMQMIWLCSSV